MVTNLSIIREDPGEAARVAGRQPAVASPEDSMQNSRMKKLGLGLCLVLASAAVASAKDCDRACLAGLVTTYVDAMIAHRPDALPLAANVRFTEDMKDQTIGEGVWKDVTRAGSFRQDYLDVRKQIAASHVELYAGDRQVLYSLILHTKDQRITGIETLAGSLPPNSRLKSDSLGKPLPIMSEPVPKGQRLNRRDMVRAALHYPEGLRIGNFTEAKTPFSTQAYRVENGAFIAGAGGPRPDTPGLFTQKIILHPDVVPSVAAVDEEAGIVLLWMNFGDTKSYGPGNALITFEAFKVFGKDAHEIHAVNAFFRTFPKDLTRGWESTDPVPAAAPWAPH
jgi:hypothetical protein